jgi:catechol 2,3-dioxygenase-like lactoylglutathione lyase family enzyme
MLSTLSQRSFNVTDPWSQKMIDHTGINVSNFEKSKTFYQKALGAIGYQLLAEFPSSVTGNADVAGFGEPSKPDFWIAGGTPNKPTIHVAFQVDNREKVDAFYNAALAAGGKDNGKPGPRPHYHERYYGAFVLDPDGHNIEAVCHR